MVDELYSLGIVGPKQRKKEINDDEELENLADIIKQAMFQDYRAAYTVKRAILIKKEAHMILAVG